MIFDASKIPLSKLINMRVIADFVVALIKNSVKHNRLPSENATPQYYGKKYVQDKSRGLAAPGRQASRFTANVNMYLTGDLINSLRVKSIGILHALIGYNSQYSRKISENEKLNRSIRTLSAKNIKICEDYVAADIERKLNVVFSTSKQVDITMNT